MKSDKKKSFEECTPKEQRELYPNICKLHDFINSTPERRKAFRMLTGAMEKERTQ